MPLNEDEFDAEEKDGWSALCGIDVEYQSIPRKVRLREGNCQPGGGVSVPLREDSRFQSMVKPGNCAIGPLSAVWYRWLDGKMRVELRWRYRLFWINRGL